MLDLRRRESEVRRLSDPTVCAVCITADRPELTRKAVACFEAQTYQAKRLVIYDTSKAAGEIVRYRGHFQHVVVGGSQQTIGDLRNSANAFASADEVIVHWDSDEHSHPNRIAEQVALLQSSGADVVGYREMLFWRESTIGQLEYALTQAQALQSDRSRDEILTGLAAALEISQSEAIYRFRKITEESQSGKANFSPVGEAWLYSNPDPRYCLGTSLCYKRTAWERKPFEATSQGEDIRWLTGMNSVGVSTIIAPNGIAFTDPMQPRMIARIHSGNTSTVYRPELMAAIERQGGEWKRAPEWDSYCRGVCE